MILYYW